MKKFTLLLATLFTVALSALAQVNNPKDTEGYYIVKWDCTANTWATSNSFEVDETFTFAIDVTNTPLETWLKGTPTNAGATRSIALNKWTGYGGLSGDSHRFKQIKGNIYGATWNLTQLATDMDLEQAHAIGAETFVFGTVFGYEYTSDNPGASWWINPIDIDPLPEAGQQSIFKTRPYTGTKTSEVFYNDDYGNDLFGDSYPIAGYAPACAVPVGIEETIIDPADVVSVEYWNLQGVRLSKEPKSGAYVKVSVLTNGSRISEKAVGMQN